MAKSKPEKWAAKLGTTALNPLQVIDLQDAVRARKKKVKLEERWFVIKYLPDGETIYYSPEGGYVPSGYLNIQRLLED